MSQNRTIKPSPAFIGASWAALAIGMGTFLISLLNADMELNEKGYYLSLLLLGLFAAISVQKSVRDRAEAIPVTNIYYGIAWLMLAAALTLLIVGLINARSISISEKLVYGVSFAMSLYAVVAIQKNVRDLATSEDPDEVQAARQPHLLVTSPSNDGALD
ncbi:putative membrane protein YiaA [Agromyces cerinus]|uniref:inner membrane protein YiaA n=1 Tax=Agromyces cerinus TaxID=33878 RepID=UPI001956C607|nr:inner membrane protein YiaA [Agromyces cerinus]MBM7831582.1 putative membrane protein YiaA [Agromyces cerinus]